MTPIDHELSQALHSTERVHGLTHNFYRYPATFNPYLARVVIQRYSQPGDWILDPFMGGGTTIVEGLSLGRRAIGVDINSLSKFITETKTTPLSTNDRESLTHWVSEIDATIDLQEDLLLQEPLNIKNLPREIHPFFVAGINLAQALRFPRQRQFARAALLGLGQSLLDCKANIPNSKDASSQLPGFIHKMFDGLDNLVTSCKASGIPADRLTTSRHLYNCPAQSIDYLQETYAHGLHPSLVITSPPYPGVHVLYHRWQVSGRKETPAPFWITNLPDGHGASFYTLGSRTRFGLNGYFQTIRTAFTNLRSFLHGDAIVAQLIAFTRPDKLLPRYLDTLRDAGFQPLHTLDQIMHNYSRVVPNRRWYASGRDNSGAAREFLLLHHPV